MRMSKLQRVGVAALFGAGLWLACTEPPQPTPSSLRLTANKDRLLRNVFYRLTAEATGVDGGLAEGMVRFRIDQGTFESDGGALRDVEVPLVDGEASVRGICDNSCPERVGAVATWENTSSSITLIFEPAPAFVDGGPEVFVPGTCSGYSSATSVLLFSDLTQGGREFGIRSLAAPFEPPCIGFDAVPPKLSIRSDGRVTYLWDGGVYLAVSDGLTRDAGATGWAWPANPQSNDSRLTTSCASPVTDYIPSATDLSLATICNGVIFVGSAQIPTLGGETPSKLWASGAGPLILAESSANKFYVVSSGQPAAVSGLVGQVRAARARTNGFDVVVLAASGGFELWTIDAAATATKVGDYQGTAVALPTRVALDNQRALYAFSIRVVDAGYEPPSYLDDGGLADAGYQLTADGGVTFIHKFTISNPPAPDPYVFIPESSNFGVPNPIFVTPYTTDATLFTGP